MTEGQTIDREQFLKDNKLGDVLDIFVKRYDWSRYINNILNNNKNDRDITIEELLEFDKTDLRTFAQDIGLDALQKNRFVKAITKLQPQQNNQQQQQQIGYIQQPDGQLVMVNLGQQISPVKQQHQGKLININDSAIVQQQVRVFLTPIFTFNSFGD